MSPPITRESVLAVENIDCLLLGYIYTRPSEARKLLVMQQCNLKQFHESVGGLEQQTGKDYDFNYHLNLAKLESQEYRHAAAGPSFREALAAVDARGDLADRLNCYLAYTGHLSNLGEIEEANVYLDRCYRLLEALPDARLRAHAACRHGFLHLLTFSYPKATRKFLEAETLLDRGTFTLNEEDHYFYSLTQSGIGTVCQHSGESKQAIEAFSRAIDRCELIGLRARLPWHRLNLGKELLAVGAYTEARDNFESVVAIRANGSNQALAAAYANLSDCHYHLGEDKMAEEHLTRAEEIYRSQIPADPIELAGIGFSRAARLMNAENWPQAVLQLQGSLATTAITDATSDPRLLSMVADAYHYLAMAQAELGDYQAAYNHHLTYDKYNQRYQDQIDLLRQRRSAAQFRAEAREREHERLKLKASQLKLQALQAQMNPHFLFNALNSIQSFISDNHAAKATKYLAKFAVLMRRSLEYSNRRTISLEEERQFLADYLDINRHLRFEGQLTYSVDLDPQLEEDIIAVPTMILQPYVENAVEHGLRGLVKGHVAVTFSPLSDRYLLATVTDNGIGRVRVAEMQSNDLNREGHQSRGTEITEARLLLLSEDGQTDLVVIEDLYDPTGLATGTRVKVKIPISDVRP